jgi:hypothetical protein
MLARIHDALTRLDNNNVSALRAEVAAAGPPASRRPARPGRPALMPRPPAPPHGPAMPATPEAAMSGNVTQDAAREAVTIAAGLPRAEIDQRARQAFDSANDIRARQRGLPDTAKRAHSTARARTWADILRHMDQAGEGEFCGHLCDNTPPAIARAAWIAWDWLAGVLWPLNIAAIARAAGDVLGARPITYYKPPRHDPTPREPAGNATPGQ